MITDLTEKTTEQPLENQQLDSLEEDRELEHRKPNLGEIEKDTSEV